MPAKRRTFLKSAGGATAAFLAGCTGGPDGTGNDGSGGGASTGTTTTSDELEQTELDVLTTYFPGMSYSPVVAAKYLGHFEEVGLNVNIDWSFGYNPLQVVTSDEFDVVVASHVDNILGKTQAVPIEAILTVQGNTPQSFGYLASKDYSELSDLAGGILGLQNAADVKAFVQEIFSRELTADERESITQTFIGYDIANVTTGQVDAMTLFPTNADQISLEQTGQEEFDYFYMKDYIEVPGNAAIADERWIAEHPNTAREYTRAHCKGVLDSVTPDMRDEVAEACVQSLNDAGVGEDLFLPGADPLEVQKESFERFVDFRWIEEWEDNGPGWNPPERIHTAQELLAQIGFINEPAMVSAEELAYNELVDQVVDDSGTLQWPM